NHPDYDDYWKKRSMNDRFEEITVPILNIGGWYDIFSKATIEMVDQVREKSRNYAARRNQFVVVGPWGHGVGGRRLGELDFGDQARLNVADLQFEWFEYWLKNKETGIQNRPAYRLFVMGENRWHNSHQWPLPETQFTKYFLNSSGGAGSNKDNGHLATSALEDQPFDTYIFDPQNPVPTRGGNNLVGIPAGPFDQSSLENRKDVLVYSTPPLNKAVKVVGPITATIYAASTAKDTDFTAKLVDVHPDGKAYNLCDGIIRARYRESFTNPKPIKPNRVYEYKIDLWVTANMFKAGHRIRLEISSSNFPRFDRNPNSGNRFGTDIKVSPATQSVHHSKEYPSHILLPIIPN
ncbi:MAG TPA: CocE/NonD family hydrolase, partial [Verrucomicrobia bacterium]|nr:CocE/NonD family hydrolase [Verrucomicrobiota bacterium]